MGKHCKKSYTNRLNLKELPAKALKFLKNNEKTVKIAVLCVFGIFSVAISAQGAGITVGYKVNYSGKTIANIKNNAVVDTANKIIADNISNRDAYSKIATPKLSVSLLRKSDLDTADSVAQKMIDNTEDIVKVCDLLIDGKTVLCYESQGLNNIIKSRLEAYYVEGAENSSSFVKKVELNESYRLKNALSSAEDVENTVNSLEVKTYVKKITDVSVPYNTKTVKTNKQPLGYIEVTTKGQNGINRKTEVFETLNGVETYYNLESNQTVSAPVTEIIEQGTAKAELSSREKSIMKSNGFILPLPSRSFNISAYWGDGRGHKGIDLATDKGTSIYAVSSGTVSFSGWDGAYGYSVIIDHGNGLQTRYAHASSLFVSYGEKVSQGDVIAAVGRTGSATGNHLHFEVMVNGTRVNPAPYIGL